MATTAPDIEVEVLMGASAASGKRSAWQTVRLLVICVCTVLAGVGNNVSFYDMGQRMPAYPLFLLYFSTMCYVTLYFLWALANILLDRERTEPVGRLLLSAPLQRQFFYLGFWLTVNGLCSQYSDPYVSGNLQSVLYQLALPATGVLAWWFLNERFNVFHLTGSALVLGGCLAVALPPFISSEESHHSTATNVTTTATPVVDCYAMQSGGSSNSPVWVLVFALSVIPVGVCAVIQEGIFHKDGGRTDPVLLLFWSNAYTLLFYVLALPSGMLPYLGKMSWDELMDNQHDAFRCLAGHHEAVCGCEKNAYISVMAFVVCYMAFFYFLALLVKEISAVFEALVNGVVTPASAIAFSFTWLMGSDAEKLHYYVIIGIIVVPAGVVLYKLPELLKAYRERNSGEQEEVPLLGGQAHGAGSHQYPGSAHGSIQVIPKII